MSLQAALVILLMLASTVKADEGGVVFWRNTVTLTCPGNGSWYDSEKMIHTGPTYSVDFKHQLKYKCKHEDANEDYLFYVKGKACENCFEVDIFHIMLVIIMDVIGTVLVMVLVFTCTEKRSLYGPTHSSKPALPSGRRPPTDTPTYQELQRRPRAD